MTKEEINQLTNDVKTVISYSQDILFDNLNVSDLITNWYTNKYEKYKHWFGDKLICECGETSFELNNEDKNNLFETFIKEAILYWDDCEFEKFLSKLTQEEFWSNRLNNDYFIECPKKKILKGTKVVKAFKYFIKNKEILDLIQNKASQIIQENKLEGILCFSIHPLDFLTISENNHKWRSCHALDGEFKAGNLSYIEDESTIVCYLKSKRDGQLRCFPSDMTWNSKKWRVLLYFSPDQSLVFIGKQYPFTLIGAQETIKEKLEDSIFDCKWSEWRQVINQLYDKKLIHSILVINRTVYNLDDIVSDADDSLQFDDLLRSNTYVPYYMEKIDDNRNWSFYQAKAHGELNRKIRVGHSVKCPCCRNRNLELTSSMACISCVENGYAPSDGLEGFGVCEFCNSVFYYDYHGGYVDDATICENCMEEYAANCCVCGETHLKENLWYDEDTEEYYCSYCRGEK